MIHRVRPRRGDDQDLLGERREIGPEVDRGLENQDLLRRRLDPEVAEDRLIGRLLLARGDHDPHAAHREQGHGAELHARAPVKGTGPGEAAVAQALDPKVGLEGLVARQARLGAQREGEGGPLPGRVSRRGGLRVVKDRERRVLGALGHQLLQQAHRIGVGPAARIVLGVGQDDRAGRRTGDPDRMADRLGRPPDVAAEFALARAGMGAEFLGRRLGRNLVVAVDDDRRPAMPDVRRREAAGEGQAGDRAPLQRRQLFVNALGRVVERAAAGHRDEEGQLPERLLPPRRSLDKRVQMARRASAGRGHVDVGVGPKRDQGIGQLDHSRRDVGVQIEARHQRQIRPDEIADPSQNLALAVLQVLGDHGSVEIQVEAVQGLEIAQVRQDLAGDPFEGLLRHRRRGGRLGPGERQQLVAERPRLLDEARDRDVDPGDRFEERRPAGQARPSAGSGEILEGRRRGREAVGLVLKAADGDAGHPPRVLAQMSA